MSAWLALVFLVEEKLADEVAVEPLSGEDLEIARSGKGDEDTSEIATMLKVKVKSLDRYIIQIKGRRAGQWTPGDLAKIIEGDAKKEVDGTSRRTWPIQVMRQHADTALLFVTDSTVSPTLSWFVVEKPTFTRRSTSRPDAAKEWGEVLPKVEDKVLTRVGVLTGQRYEFLEHNIDKILASKLHVPHAQRAVCRDELVTRFRVAMLSESSARIRLEEIRNMAARHDGLPGGPDPFVEPRNWATIRRFLDEKHAIVLVGEPGVGKTTLAERLVYEHRILAEPFLVVKPRSAAELNSLYEMTEPVIVYVEDPFGRYRPGDTDDEWRMALERCCSKVRVDLKLIVTSRAAFADHYLDDATAAPRLGKHRFLFDENNFDRDVLLRKHLDDEELADPELRTWIESNAAMIMHYLSRPFSYGVFATRVAALQPAQRTRSQLKKLAKEASTAEIGKELERTFERESESVRRGLAAIWLAFECWPYHPRLEGQLAELEETLLDINAEVAGAKAKLIKHRWLRRHNGTIRMHPIYLHASLRVFEETRAIVIPVVDSILRKYLNAKNISDLEAVFRAVTRKKFVRESLEPLLADCAKDCLRSIALAGGRSEAFASALTLLTANGQPEDPVAMLASALCREKAQSGRTGSFYRDSEWFPPTWANDDEKTKRVANHPDVPATVRAFVKRGFPTLGPTWSAGASRLIAFLYRLVDVSAEFDALLTRIDEFSEFHVDVVAIGAAHSKDANPEHLLERAFAEERALDVWIREFYPYDEDSYAANEHLDDIAHGRMRPVRALVDAVLEVQAISGERAWATTRREPLVFERFAERVAQKQERDHAVIRQVFVACPSESKLKLVNAIFANRDCFEFALELLPQVASYQWRDLLDRHVRDHYDEPLLRARLIRTLDVLREPALALTPLERCSLAFTLFGVEEYSTLYETIVNQLAETERAALSVLLAEPGASPRQCATLLEQIADSKISGARRAIVALAGAGYSVEDRIDVWLSMDGDVDDAIAALDAAAAAPSPKSLEFARRGLTHQRAKVRSRALALLGNFADEEAVDAILSVTEDPTGSVRIAAATALAGRTESRAWQSLVKRLADATDTSEEACRGEAWHDYHEPEYAVAEAAARALAALRPWPQEVEAAIKDFLSGGSSTRRAVNSTLVQKATDSEPPSRPI